MGYPPELGAQLIQLVDALQGDAINIQQRFKKKVTEEYEKVDTDFEKAEIMDNLSAMAGQIAGLATVIKGLI